MAENLDFNLLIVKVLLYTFLGQFFIFYKKSVFVKFCNLEDRKRVKFCFMQKSNFNLVFFLQPWIFLKRLYFKIDILIFLKITLVMRLQRNVYNNQWFKENTYFQIENNTNFFYFLNSLFFFNFFFKLFIMTLC